MTTASDAGVRCGGPAMDVAGRHHRPEAGTGSPRRLGRRWLVPLGSWPTAAAVAAVAVLVLCGLRIRRRRTTTVSGAGTRGGRRRRRRRGHHRSRSGQCTAVAVTALAAEGAVVTHAGADRGRPGAARVRGRPGGQYLLISAKAVEVVGRGRSYAVSVPVLLTADTRWSGVRPGERYRADRPAERNCRAPTTSQPWSRSADHRCAQHRPGPSTAWPNVFVPGCGRPARPCRPTRPP